MKMIQGSLWGEIKVTEQVKVKIMEGGHRPEKKTAGAAAWDCYARIDEKEVQIEPGTMGVKIPLGFAVELPKGYHAEIFPRSSLGTKTPLRISNGAGIIDSDYRGEVCLLVDNIGLLHSDTLAVHDGDRIAQMLIVRDPDVEIIQVDELSKTERGTGGFGSTGRR